MPQVQITIAELQAPSPNSRSRNPKVKIENYEAGVFYDVPAALAPQLAPGQTYSVEYTETVGRTGAFAGKKFRTIAAIHPATAARAPQQNGGQRPASGYSGPNKDEQIFVTAILARAVQAGHVNGAVVTEVIETGRKLRDAFKLIFNVDMPKQAPQPQQQFALPQQQEAMAQPYDPELNDPIPY